MEPEPYQLEREVYLSLYRVQIQAYETQIQAYETQIQAYETQIQAYTACIPQDPRDPQDPQDPRDPHMHVEDTYTEAASYICIQDWGYYIGGAVYKDITICRTYDFGPISPPKYKSAAISKTELKENFRKIA